MLPLCTTPNALAGEREPASSAQVITLHTHRRALAVRDLARAVRHRDVCAALARGALDAVEVLAAHAVAAGGLDYAGALGLQLAVYGARDTAAELAEARRTVEVIDGGISDA